MRITQRQLRRIVEAEVDKMRLPKGPNSRDPDEDVNDLAEARLHEEADPMIGDMLTVARDFDDYLYEIYDDLEQGSGSELSA